MPLPVQGVVFRDDNGNGTQDPGEPGLANLTVQILDSSLNVAAATTTDNSGNYSYDTNNLSGGNFIVHVVLPFGLVGGVGQDNSFQLPTFATEIDINVALVPIECTNVVSHWVVKICWVPSQGVQVTYKHHHGGTITVIYPGTTQADYDAFIAAPSKGRWADLFYRHRPYLIVQPSP